MTVTPILYKAMTGSDPIGDQLERVNCPLAGVRHAYCGVCPECDIPRFICKHPGAKHDRRAVGDRREPQRNERRKRERRKWNGQA